MKDGGEEVEGALNPAKEWVPERVEAKTDVVRCKCFYFSLLAHTLSLSPFNDIFTIFDSIEDGKQIPLNLLFMQLQRTTLTSSPRKPISPISTNKTTYLNIRERMVTTTSHKAWR